MNFFKGKGPDAAEESRENRVKKKILTEFSSLLKRIQFVQQSRPGEPIYTCDEADRLCIMFDSVFIHRLKSGEQMRGLELKHIHEQHFNFWSFVRRFTHRGTIEQIEKLSHLQTPVGYCRSWVRMAVSDGLMESYLTSMIQQPDVLRKYYHSIAFLRDSEQSDILLKLIQILSHFDFQLVYNSQELNKWTTDSLGVSGYIKQITQSEQIVSQLLPPPTPAQTQTQTDKTRSQSLDMDDVEFVISTPGNVRQPDHSLSNQTVDDGKEASSKSHDLRGTSEEWLENSNQTVGGNSAQSKPEVDKKNNLTVTHKQHDDFDNRLPKSYNIKSETVREPQIAQTMSDAKLRAKQELDRLRNMNYTLSDVFETEPISQPEPPSITDSINATTKPEESLDHAGVLSELTEKLTVSEEDGGTKMHDIDDLMTADLGGVEADESEDIYTTGDNSESVAIGEDNSTDNYLKENNPNHITEEDDSDSGDKSGNIYSVEETAEVKQENSEAIYADDVNSGNICTGEHNSTEASSAGVASEGDVYTSRGNGEAVIEREDSTEYSSVLDEEFYSLPSSNEGSTEEQTVEPDSTPQRIFKVGTPENTSYMAEDKNTESSGSSITEYDDNFRDKVIEERSPPTTENITGSLPELTPPLSAAKIIMDRNQTGLEQHSISRSLPKDSLEGQVLPVSGSLGRGNSLASLTGWSGVESVSLPKSSNLSHVTSLADIISSSPQQESIIPIITELYTDVTSHTALNSTVENTVTDEIDNKQISEPDTPPKSPDDFELVEDYQDTCADILSYYGQIRNEPGLDEQDFQCHSCQAPIGIIYGAARVCRYTGSYYCLQCHNNEDSIIPSRVVCNWDFAKYKVSKASKDFLVTAEVMPLLNLDSLNYKIYEHVPELERCRKLRVQLNYIRRYLLACGPAISEELRLLVAPKEYLYEEVHSYSVQDLLLINISPTLTRVLRKSVKFGSAHVKKCSSCEYRGFRCETCRTTEILFPFELEKTYTCELCNAVYHRLCFTDTCSKCERLKHRDQLLASSPVAQDDNLMNDSITIHT